jgi:outer membrane biosynthesis protein TonB
MTYHELVKKVQTALAKADASKIGEHIAVQVNVTGEAEGAFYMEVSDGVLYVAPYDYNDRDALLTISDADILAIAEGKQTMMKAYEEGKVQVDLPHDRSLEKLLMLGEAIPAKKAVVKKPAEKKEEEVKPAEAKTAEPVKAAPAEEKPKKAKKPATEKKPAVVSNSKKSTAKKTTPKK